MWHLLRPWIFPVSCLGCGSPEIALCPACAPPPSERVATLVADVRIVAAGSYAGVLRRAIVAMKHGERAYLEPFAAAMAELVPGGVPLVPLPTTRGRRADRGFDQAIELARRIASRRDGSVSDVLVKRGGAQRGRRRRERIAGGGRFRCRPDAVLPAYAIVVDDVCTTGATLADGITTLRAAGVAVVGGVVLARTSLDRNSRR